MRISSRIFKFDHVWTEKILDLTLRLIHVFVESSVLILLSPVFKSFFIHNDMHVWLVSLYSCYIRYSRI